LLLAVDNGSVFTKRISELLRSANTDFDLRAFDDVRPDSLGGYDSFILSGRRGNDKSMNALNARIIRHCVAGSKKLLGICYGAELLVLTLGGTIRKMDSLQKGSETITISRTNPLASDKMDVYESHSYELAKLGDELESVGSSKACRHEIIRHRDKKIFGTQFHPEMSRDGARLIGAFLRL